MAFGLVAIAAVLDLGMGQDVWDDLGYAAEETGMVFCTLMLLTGSIWAKPIWRICLGRLVDLGFAPDDDAGPMAALRRIFGARTGGRHARGRAPGRGGRHRQRARRADHNRLGAAVAHDPSGRAGDAPGLSWAGRSA